MLSLIIPVYRNAENITALLAAVAGIHSALSGSVEIVFVVDGSPDDSYLRLLHEVPKQNFRAQLVNLSRNFGSFSAIRAGLQVARGTHFAVMAADLQEPPDLILEFSRRLSTGSADVVIGTRTGRDDPLLSRLSSNVYWWFYRRYIQAEVPVGGVDIFGCSDQVRKVLLELNERNSSLVGLLLWSGFRRELVPYSRLARQIGTSGWTLAKKVRYMTDSIFGFSDLPIRFLMRLGVGGLLASFLFATVVAIARIAGTIPVPGYAATILTVVFFGALNCFGLGVIGNYVWRTFENTKGRPNFVIQSRKSFRDTTS